MVGFVEWVQEAFRECILLFSSIIRAALRILTAVLSPGTPACAEPGKGRVIRCLPVFEKPHKIYTVPASLFQLAGGIDPTLVSVCHYLKQHLRGGDRFSSLGRIRFIQFPVVQFLKLGAGHADGCVLW